MDLFFIVRYRVTSQEKTAKRGLKKKKPGQRKMYVENWYYPTWVPGLLKNVQRWSTQDETQSVVITQTFFDDTSAPWTWAPFIRGMSSIKWGRDILGGEVVRLKRCLTNFEEGREQSRVRMNWSDKSNRNEKTETARQWECHIEKSSCWRMSQW
jgi:hypothetical protein